MNIKSLLIGSAAALVAVSGARAADAIVAAPDPEPVEYVRVCDAAGTGYFYIPGTETCLRIHGYVRYDAGFGDLNGKVSDTGDDTWNKRARASFRVSTWSATDMGDLKTYVETRWQYDTNGNGATYSTAGEFSINFAYIQLGGLRIGKDESAFTTYLGYAGSVINDCGNGCYGPFDTNLISYTFTGGNGFSAIIAFEQGDGSPGWLIDDYVPHVVAGIGFEQGWGSIKAVVGYDTRDGAGRGGWAAKVRGDFNITDGVSAFVMVGYGENSSGYTAWATGAGETIAVWAGASAKFSDNVTGNIQVGWTEGNGALDDIWAVAANVNYTVVPGFVVTPEVQWVRDTSGTSQWGGVVRFQRSF